MNEPVKVTEYTVNDDIELLFNMRYRVIEMGFFEWLTIKAIGEILIERNEHPTAEDVIAVHAMVSTHDMRVWISGPDTADVMATIKFIATQRPDEFEIEEEVIEVTEFVKRYFYYDASPDNRELERVNIWYPIFDTVKFRDEPLPISFRQLVSLNNYAHRVHNQFEILGMTHGTLFIKAFEMTIGIEPDGYIHS